MNSIRLKKNNKNEISVVNSYSIKFLLEGYKSYLLKGIEEKSEENTVFKAQSQFKKFLEYSISFREGHLSLQTFIHYSNYLQQLVDNEEISSSQKALRRMYARRINLSNGKEGYLVWLHKNAYRIVSSNKDKVLAKNWSKDFEDWLKLQSKLTRNTDYSKVISNIVGMYLRWLKKSDYNEISALSVNVYLREQAHLKISTLNLYLKAIKRFASFFELSSDHPNRHSISQEIQTLKKFEDSIQTVNRIGLGKKDIQSLYENSNDKQKLILHLGLKMGLRGSSMLNLSVKDINFVTKKMAVWLKGKNNREYFPIPPELVSFLKDYISGHHLLENDKLLNYRSTAISSLSKYFSDFLKTNNLKEIEKEGEVYTISLHNLRHTFAYNSLDKFGLLTTSKLLGHASTQITEQYYLQDKVRDIFNNLYDYDEEWRV